MTFDDAFSELEQEFRERVVKDKQQWGFESIFLPNLKPKGPVDFVLVGMEPSLRRWAKDFEVAQQKIDCGFHNFFRFETFESAPNHFVLQFCISKYLCCGAETYYLTDFAKGAMKTGSPGTRSEKKYEAWYPLLERELGLVAKPEAKVISIGSTVRNFLTRKGLHGYAGTIQHYSGTASGYRGKEIEGRELRYSKFAKKIDNLPDGTQLSKSRKKLIFDYKIAFERIRAQEEKGWPSWRRWYRERIT